METHSFQPFPSGFSLEHTGTRQGRPVEAADIDDDDIDEVRPVKSEPGTSSAMPVVPSLQMRSM